MAKNLRLSLRDLWRNARETVSKSVIDAKKGDQEVDLTQPYRMSRGVLGNYVTLDWPHRISVGTTKQRISEYAQDSSRRRPLNIMMLAEPGSGKSHLVRSLASSLGEGFGAVDCNMASLQSVEDLLQPLDQVRSLKVRDRLPILFLDEFDSRPENYAMLLPLLWDGELHVAHRDLKLGKLVVILAGSGQRIARAMTAARAMDGSVSPEGDGKLSDLLSRINGGDLEIPPMDLVEADRDRRVDKVCLTASLLQTRFGDQLETAPLCLLRFVAKSQFRYGVRSIAHLVDLIKAGDKGSPKSIEVDQLAFPLRTVDQLRRSSLAMHIYSRDGAAAIVSLWTDLIGDARQVRFLQAAVEPNAEDKPYSYVGS